MTAGATQKTGEKASRLVHYLMEIALYGARLNQRYTQEFSVLGFQCSVFSNILIPEGMPMNNNGEPVRLGYNNAHEPYMLSLMTMVARRHRWIMKVAHHGAAIPPRTPALSPRRDVDTGARVAGTFTVYVAGRSIAA